MVKVNQLSVLKDINIIFALIYNYFIVRHACIKNSCFLLILVLFNNIYPYNRHPVNRKDSYQILIEKSPSNTIYTIKWFLCIVIFNNSNLFHPGTELTS